MSFKNIRYYPRKVETTAFEEIFLCIKNQSDEILNDIPSVRLL